MEVGTLMIRWRSNWDKGAEHLQSAV